MIRHSLYFTAPYTIELRSESLPKLKSGQVLVRALCSAISSGSEMLFYRGQFDPDLSLDTTMPALRGPSAYPLKYGYSMVGEVVEEGTGAYSGWLGRRVFAFQPHENYFIAPFNELMPIPDHVSSENAVFLPNMETALNFVMDGTPMIGEKVVVFGQGIVGLLTTALLTRFPLQTLVTLDCYPLRQQVSLNLGARASFDPAYEGVLTNLTTTLQGPADLTYEISGAPQALNQAIAITGFTGRVVIGSWYGSKPAILNLGGEFHRSRIRLLSSQVSTLDPTLSGRWDKQRRFNLAWEMLSKIQPAQFITQRFPLDQAAQAYQLIDHHPEQTIQVLLSYA